MDEKLRKINLGMDTIFGAGRFGDAARSLSGWRYRARGEISAGDLILSLRND